MPRSVAACTDSPTDRRRTAARALDQLGFRRDGAHNPVTLLISGASGDVGSAAVQLAVARGARVIGTASPAKQELVRSLGAEPVVYGDGLSERVRAITPDGVETRRVGESGRARGKLVLTVG